jgi:PAS domain S-box-containing protein
MMESAEILNMLIVEDDEDDFFIIREILQSLSYTITMEWCYSYDKALELIRSGKYNFYLVDFMLGKKTGLELFSDVHTEGFDTPFILLTGMGNTDIAIQAMKAGVTDYPVKDQINKEKMERSIRYALERKKTLSELKENENKFRTIFENSKDVNFLTDDRGFIKEINQAGKDLLVQLNIPDRKWNLAQSIKGEADKERIQKIFELHGSAKDWEIELFSTKAGIRNCLLSIFSASSNLGDFQGILHDITERKKKEKNSFQVEKLQAAGRFIRTLAHEVRNPLNNINLALEEIQEQNTKNELIFFINIINRNSGRINALISELLHSLRNTEFAMARCDLKTTLDESIQSAKDALSLREIQLNRAYTQEPLYLQADQGKLASAFLNLIQNAIDAVESKTGLIDIICEKTNGQIQVIIRDNGCGIAEENIIKLFEPYFTTKKNGMGLGMLASLNIIQAHNGSIEVYSEVGKGSSFHIFFNE